MYDDRNQVKVNTTVSIPFGTISWIVWIVFMILYYGVKVDWLTPFWVWFPFWLPFALAGAAFVLVFIIAIILAALDN